MNILIADDDIASRRLLETILRRAGNEVVVANDGESAWALLQRDDCPDVAILDWEMPGMTGPEICKLVRERLRQPYIYIFLLTSRRSKWDFVQGMDAGADDYLSKPFDPQELNARLRAARRLLDLQAELFTTREALRERATKDSLTRVWNRPSIIETLQSELARAKKTRLPVAAALLDIDHFKMVNDTYGHHAGDIVLAEVANRLQLSTRHEDSVGRFGGEEFLVVMPGAGSHAVSPISEGVRLRVCEKPVLLPSLEISVTVCLGVAVADPDREEDAESLIQRADEALYAAKRQGRNRVILHKYLHPAFDNCASGPFLLPA